MRNQDCVIIGLTDLRFFVRRRQFPNGREDGNCQYLTSFYRQGEEEQVRRFRRNYGLSFFFELSVNANVLGRVARGVHPRYKEVHVTGPTSRAIQRGMLQRDFCDFQGCQGLLNRIRARVLVRRTSGTNVVACRRATMTKAFYPSAHYYVRSMVNRFFR